MDNSIRPSLCRACLSETGEFKSVFVSDDNCDYTIHLSEMIMACASVQITFGDGLPEQICLTCVEQTVKLYLFKHKCEESDKMLRERLERPPWQQIGNIREKKYSESIEMSDNNGTDLSGTIKSEINIDECHLGDVIDDKTQALFGLNETENNGSEIENRVLVCNKLSNKEDKYSEYIEMKGCNVSDLKGTIKSDITIDESHVGDVIEDKIQATFGLNETENKGNDIKNSVLVCNKLSNNEEKYFEFIESKGCNATDLNGTIKSGITIDESYVVDVIEDKIQATFGLNETENKGNEIKNSVLVCNKLSNKEDKYSEYIEMKGCNASDLKGTIKSDITIDESYVGDVIEDKIQATFGLNETENKGRDIENSVLIHSKLSNKEEKYSEYIKSKACNGTDLNGTIKLEITIDECHLGNVIDDKTQSSFRLNETENIDSERKKPALGRNELCKKKLKCEFCYKTFSTQSLLNRHIKSHSAVKEFECDTCNKRFSRKHHLLRHKITHAKKMDDSKLEFGDFNSEDDFEDNKIIKKSETEFYPLLECNDLMNKEEVGKKDRKQHNKVSSNISSQGCTKKFRKQALLNRHLRTHCKPHICSTCNKGFFKPEQLINHMSVHSGVKPYICDICSKGFNQSSNLKNHMRSHISKEPFLCSTCGKGFKYLGKLREHTSRHSGIKAHPCNTCGFSFASGGELSIHLRIHTGVRPFVCPICSRGFTTSSRLAQHKRIHSGEKPYECDVCKMKFTQLSNLKRHKRTHTGEKPYVCNICAKSYSQSTDLRSHLRIHTGEMPYICDVCEIAFRRSSTLRKHKKTHRKRTVSRKRTVIGGSANGGFLK